MADTILKVVTNDRTKARTLSTHAYLEDAVAAPGPRQTSTFFFISDIAQEEVAEAYTEVSPAGVAKRKINLDTRIANLQAKRAKL